jgi:zinc protease
MKDLDAASIDDVRDFFHTFYVPSNATVALVGDFEPTQAMQLVSQYLGRVPKADRPVPRDIPKEPPQTKEKRVTLQEAWPLPAVVVAHHITYDGNPDSYPLHIAAKVLSDGQSSRIYKKLVYDTQMAVAAFGQANLIEDPNLFYVVGIVQPGHTTDEVAKALIAELDRLKEEPITEHELQRTKNQFARDYILGRERDQDKAMDLAHALVIHHDIKTADGEFETFQSITASDVQRVARTYFTPENRLVLTIVPAKTGQVGRAGEVGRVGQVGR